MKKRDGVYITNVMVNFKQDLIHPIDGTIYDELEIIHGGKKSLIIKSDESILATLACALQGEKVK
mgnify:CR=1 FL=1